MALDTVENANLINTIASKGRYGDTKLVHVTDKEAEVIDSLFGPSTLNPDTGLEEHFIGDLLGGIGSIASAIFGSNAQDQANKIANKTSQRNYELALRALNAALADQIDARGNRIVYDEETGTIQFIPTQTTENLIAASDQEELMRLTHDAALRRTGLVDNANRRADEGQAAESYLAQLQAPSPYSREQIEAAYIDQALNEIDRQFDEVSSNVSTQALRSGADASTFLADLGQQRADSARGALVDAVARSFRDFEGIEGQRDNRLATLYNMFATRASNIDDTPFAPTTAGLGQGIPDRSNEIAYGAGVAGNLNQQAGALLADPSRYQSPIPSIIAGVGGLFNDFSGLQDRTKTKSKSDVTNYSSLIA